MKTKLHIQTFVEQNSDWELKLAEKPYCIQISRANAFGRNLIMFKYNQIESDFNMPIVRECRGIIFDEDTFEPVCVPFFKFGNAGESYCPEIDWSSAWCGSKIDGSLIKIVRLGNDLLISTNGTILADAAPLAEQIGCTTKSFGGLVDLALANAGIKSRAELCEMLDEGWTYMFELTSCFNKVVVQFHEPKLWFLGCRNNDTMQEMYFTKHSLKNHFDVPDVISLKSLDECIAAAEMLDKDHEGFVVCDKDFNRVKVKSSLYVRLHHMCNNHVMSYIRGIEVVRQNEISEVVTYFPEFAEHLKAIKEKYDAYVELGKNTEENIILWIKQHHYDNQLWWIQGGGQKRKEYAQFIMKEHKNFSGFAFSLVDNKVSSFDDWIKCMPSKNLAIALGYKE